MKKRIRNPILWRRLLSLAAVPMVFFNAGIINEVGVINVTEVKAVETNERFIYVAENGNDYTGNGSSGSPYRSIKKAADEVTPRYNCSYPSRNVH